MVSDSSDAGQDLALRAAWMYYNDGLTQSQIAAQLFVSRPTVGRLIEHARRDGLVRIEFAADGLASLDLSRQVQHRYGLKETIVVPTVEPGLPAAKRNERLATAAAAYVRRYLHPGALVGVAWGDAVHRTLARLPESALEDVTFSSLTGGIEHLTQRISSSPAYAGRLRAIPAPLVLSSPQVAAMLREEEVVKSAIEAGRNADVVLTGIGAARPEGSSVTSGLVTNDEVARFSAMGAVGDMLGEWFDAQGDVVRSATSDRRIGLDLDELRQMPHIVGIAGGSDKVDAIAGALAGHYLTVLVTDEEAAEGLLSDSMVPSPHLTSGASGSEPTP